MHNIYSIHSMFNFGAVSSLRTSECQQVHYFITLYASVVHIYNLKQIMKTKDLCYISETSIHVHFMLVWQEYVSCNACIFRILT